jgi:GTP1/Obg family GTP-binding protein
MKRPYLFTVKPQAKSVIIYAASQLEAESIARNRYGRRAEFVREITDVLELLAAQEVVNA